MSFDILLNDVLIDIENCKISRKEQEIIKLFITSGKSHTILGKEINSNFFSFKNYISQMLIKLRIPKKGLLQIFIYSKIFKKKYVVDLSKLFEKKVYQLPAILTILPSFSNQKENDNEKDTSLTIEEVENFILKLFNKYEFSRKEQEVVKELIKGKSNKEISADLFTVEKTTKFHLTSIFKKTNTKNRNELIFFIYNNIFKKYMDTNMLDYYELYKEKFK